MHAMIHAEEEEERGGGSQSIFKLEIILMILVICVLKTNKKKTNFEHSDVVQTCSSCVFDYVKYVISCRFLLYFGVPRLIISYELSLCL